MKTQASLKARNFFSTNNQSLQLCFGKLSLCWRSWLQVLQWKEKVLQMKSSGKKIFRSLSYKNLSRMTRRPALAGLGGAVHKGEIVKAFPRVFVGLVMVVILAPYADIFYTRLDFNDRVSPDVWYYESYHWLFLCLGPYLKSVFYTVGLYLIFARGSFILSLIAAYALMYDIGKIFWLLQVSNHDEYKSLPANWYLAYGFLAGLFMVLMFDRLTHWFNHRAEAFKRRMDGLHQIAFHVDAETFRGKVVDTLDYRKKVESFKA